MNLWAECGNCADEPVSNYTDRELSYTRIIARKRFVFGTQPRTAVTGKHPAAQEPGDEPSSAANDEANTHLRQRDAAQAAEGETVSFDGRLDE